MQPDARLREYELLRAEILHADGLIVRVIGVFLALIGIIIGQGFVSGEPYVFLVPFPIIWAVSRYVDDKRWSIWLIASYLRRHLEGPSGPSWETWLFAYRQKAKDRHLRFCPAQNVMLVECVLFNLISLSCGGCFIAFALRAGLPYGSLASPLVLCAFIAICTIRACMRLFRPGRAGSPLLAALPNREDFASALKDIAPVPAESLYPRAESRHSPV